MELLLEIVWFCRVLLCSLLKKFWIVGSLNNGVIVDVLK